jgi:hypothetical protein
VRGPDGHPAVIHGAHGSAATIDCRARIFWNFCAGSVSATHLREWRGILANVHSLKRVMERADAIRVN